MSLPTADPTSPRQWRNVDAASAVRALGSRAGEGTGSLRATAPRRSRAACCWLNSLVSSRCRGERCSAGQALGSSGVDRPGAEPAVEAGARDYGVVVRSRGRDGEQVSLVLTLQHRRRRHGRASPNSDMTSPRWTTTPSRLTMTPPQSIMASRRSVMSSSRSVTIGRRSRPQSGHGRSLPETARGTRGSRR